MGVLIIGDVRVRFRRAKGTLIVMFCEMALLRRKVKLRYEGEGGDDCLVSWIDCVPKVKFIFGLESHGKIFCDGIADASRQGKIGYCGVDCYAHRAPN